MHFSVRTDRASGARTVTMRPGFKETSDEGQAIFATNVSSYSEYLLPMRYEMIGTSVRFYYDVTGLISVNEFLKKQTMTVNFLSLCMILRGLIDSCKYYKANPELIEWDPAHIYIDENTGNWRFMFAPVQTSRPRSQCIDMLRFISGSHRVISATDYDNTIREYLRSLPTVGFTYNMATMKQIFAQFAAPTSGTAREAESGAQATEKSNQHSGYAPESTVGQPDDIVAVPADGATVLASSMMQLPEFSGAQYAHVEPTDAFSPVGGQSFEPREEQRNESSVQPASRVESPMDSEPAVQSSAQPSAQSSEQLTAHSTVTSTVQSDAQSHIYSAGYANDHSPARESMGTMGSWGTGTSALIVLTRLSDQTVYPIAAYQATIGRSSRSMIHVGGNSDISRIHVTVEIVDGGFEITDMDSRNGTFVDGVQVPPHHTVKASSPVRLRLAEEDFILEKR